MYTLRYKNKVQIWIFGVFIQFIWAGTGAGYNFRYFKFDKSLWVNFCQRYTFSITWR